MNFTEEDFELFKKYKPTVYYKNLVDIYDHDKKCYIRSNIPLGDVERYLSVYCISEIRECQFKALKLSIFKEEIKDIIAEEE